MHRDKNRNEIISARGDSAAATIGSPLGARHAEMLALPDADAAITMVVDKKIYQFITTADGSPSVRMAAVDQQPEAMHHSGGALSESLFIYGEALKAGVAAAVKPNIISVGLGCAYNEWIAIAEFKKNFTAQESSFYLESFEADENLHQTFSAFLEGKPAETTIQQSLAGTFAWVLDLVSAKYSLTSEDLLKAGQQIYREKRWLLRGRLTAETKFARPFGVIFFDAFSSKATPELWSEEFFAHFLKNTADLPSVFATYAATGSLNRSLKKAGFELAARPGFQNKRESTRAFRYGRV